MTPPPTTQHVTAEFRFSNAGPYPVAVTGLRTSCGCTTAAAALRTYRPGESGTVTATFTPGDRQGEQIKTITVTTDDPAGPTTALTFHITLPRVLDLTPASAYWLIGDLPSAKTIDLRPTTPTRILSATPADDRLTATLTELDPGRHYTLTLTPKTTEIALHTHVTLRLDAPADQRQEFSVSVLVIKDARATTQSTMAGASWQTLTASPPDQSPPSRTTPGTPAARSRSA